MAYQDPGAEVRRRVEALVRAVNAALRAHYSTTQVSASDQISVRLSPGAGGKARTPEVQASYVLKGKSWTCNGSHMADGAKHILMHRGGSVVWDLRAVAKADKAAWDVLVKAWDQAMAVHDLRTFAGKRRFDPGGGDAFHMELPSSRLTDHDPRVIKCLEIYAKATRIEGKAKNFAYENLKGSRTQKAWLRAYDLKLARKGGP